VSGRAEHSPGPPADDDRGSGHTWLDHTSEISVRLHAPSFPGLIAEGARAFSELVPEHLGSVEAPEWREFTLEGGDRAGSLVDWLNELVFQAEVERWVPAELSVREGPREAGRDGIVHVRARGRTLERPFVLVKAATLHGVQLRSTPRGLEAEVTLDI
jgi:SHS2 domain-containing protein